MASYCTVLLNPQTKGDVLAACIQAAAALQAGETQAWATELSALATVVTGLLALGAGVLAYKAATEQTRQTKLREDARITAYTVQLKSLVERALAEANVIAYYLEENRRSENKSVVPINLTMLRDELQPANWERHALLKQQTIERVAFAHEAVSSFLHELSLRPRPIDMFVDAENLLMSARFVMRRCDELLALLNLPRSSSPNVRDPLPEVASWARPGQQ